MMKNDARIDSQRAAPHAQQKKVVTKRHLEFEVAAIIKAVGQVVAELTKRIDALEQRPPLAYLGIWTEGTTYARGNFVTHAGAIWHSDIENNQTRPGSDADGWTLAVKSGRR